MMQVSKHWPSKLKEQPFSNHWIKAEKQSYWVSPEMNRKIIHLILQIKQLMGKQKSKMCGFQAVIVQAAHIYQQCQTTTWFTTTNITIMVNFLKPEITVYIPFTHIYRKVETVQICHGRTNFLNQYYMKMRYVAHFLVSLRRVNSTLSFTCITYYAETIILRTCRFVESSRN